MTELKRGIHLLQPEHRPFLLHPQTLVSRRIHVIMIQGWPLIGQGRMLVVQEDVGESKFGNTLVEVKSKNKKNV